MQRIFVEYGITIDDDVTETRETVDLEAQQNKENADIKPPFGNSNQEMTNVEVFNMCQISNKSSGESLASGKCDVFKQHTSGQCVLT